MKVPHKLKLIRNGVLCHFRWLSLVPELSFYVPSGLKEIYSKEYKIIWKIKLRELKNKTKLGDFNCTMDEMNRDGWNKTQRLYRRISNYTLSKVIVDNWLEDLWRRENPDSSEFTHYDRSFGTRSRVYRVYTDIKTTNNTKINHRMVSFTNPCNTICLDRLPSKTKTGND